MHGRGFRSLGGYSEAMHHLFNQIHTYHRYLQGCFFKSFWGFWLLLRGWLVANAFLWNILLKSSFLQRVPGRKILIVKINSEVETYKRNAKKNFFEYQVL